VDGVLWLGAPWTSPGLRVEVGHGGVPGLSVSFGGAEQDVGVYVDLGVASLYLGVERAIPPRWRRVAYDRAEARARRLNEAAEREGHERWVYAYQLDPFYGRHTGVRVFDGVLWIDLWALSGDWAPWYRRVAPWNGGGWQFHIPWRPRFLPKDGP
jgi:hypothetical protein